jgi:hypothetical protein
MVGFCSWVNETERIDDPSGIDTAIFGVLEVLICVIFSVVRK